MKKILLIAITLLSLGFAVSAQETLRPSQFIIQTNMEMDDKQVTLIENEHTSSIESRFIHGNHIALNLYELHEYTLVVEGYKPVRFMVDDMDIITIEHDDVMDVTAAVIQH